MLCTIVKWNVSCNFSTKRKFEEEKQQSRQLWLFLSSRSLSFYLENIGLWNEENLFTTRRDENTSIANENLISCHRRRNGSVNTNETKGCIAEQEQQLSLPIDDDYKTASLPPFFFTDIFFISNTNDISFICRSSAFFHYAVLQFVRLRIISIV